MGSELVSGLLTPYGGRVNDSAPISYTDCFYEHLSYYLSIGMTWDEFWNDDCVKTKYHRQAYQLKKKEKNNELWLQGLYVYEAIADLVPVLQFSMSNKSRKPHDYPAQPYALDDKERKEQQERQEKEKAERFKAKMSAWAIRTNKAMASEKEVKADE